MKRCPDCAAEFEEEYTFCSEDGSILKLINEMKPAIDSAPRPVRPLQPSLSVRSAPRLGQSGDGLVFVAAPKAANPEARMPSVNPGPTSDQSEETRPISFYCPACTSEFPPPFTHCPIDQLPLKARTGKTEVAAGPKTSRAAALAAGEPHVQEADLEHPDYEAVPDFGVDSAEPGRPEPNRLEYTDPEEPLFAVPLEPQHAQPVDPQYDKPLEEPRVPVEEPQYDKPLSLDVDPVDPPQPEPVLRRVAVVRQKTSDRPRPYIEPPPRRAASVAGRQDAPKSRALRPERPLRVVPGIVERQTPPERRTPHLEQPPRRVSATLERHTAPNPPAAPQKATARYRKVERPMPEFESPGLVEESTRRPSFSIAAAVIAGGLLVAATIAVIAVFSILHRRAPARAPEVTSSPAVAQPELFVPTPLAALDYSSSSGQVPLPATEATSASTDTTARSKNDPNGKNVVESKRSDRGPLAGRTPTERVSGPAIPPRASGSAPRIPEAESPAPVRPTPGRLSWDSLSSHLVRSSSARTSRGLHYELTFSLQDQTGRQSYLRGLTILTRSRSGATRTQSIPFAHRLGANGSLTFTVGVDMPGTGAGDWGGHMSLVVTGTDSAGGPVQSRFGVPLAP